MFTRLCLKHLSTKCLRRQLGLVMDADFFGVAWALVAATAGIGLAVAAMKLWRRTDEICGLEFDGGYNALATQLDPR